MDNIVEIWKRVLDSIKPEFSTMQVSYTTWIESIIPVDITDDKIIISVPYEYNRDMIQMRYIDLIKNALYMVTGKTLDIDIILNSEEVKKEKKIKTNLNPVYTFDTFVIGKSNQIAHARALSIAEGTGLMCNPFFLYGGVGLGKTHLMHAIGNYVIKKNPSTKVLYVTSEQFTNDMVNAIRKGTTQEMREKYRTVDYLLIDDIQFISDKEGTQEEFFHTFNELYQNNKYIIISSDRPPKDLPTFMDRLISRFQDGAPTDIIPPDFETRIAILKNKASQLKLDIPDDVYNYIAKNIKSNIRELEGAIKKIMLHQMFMKQKIDVSLAEEALKDIINEKKKKITPDHIIALVERTFNLKENELKSNSRSQKITYPRQIAMYLLKTHTNLSLKQIAACFNKKDHTTIMYAVEKIVSAIDNDSATSKIISDIEKDLQS